jgi:hypothetical protein
MKYLKKFFESNSPLDEIKDNFQFINDEFGDAIVSESKFGDSKKYLLRWDLKFDMSKMNKLDLVFNKIKLISELLDDIKSASSILDDHDFDLSITDELRIEILPKETGSESFEFIKNYEWRTLKINKNEIQRFFRSKGVNVIDWEETFDEYSESGDVEFILDQESHHAISEFKSLFDRELENRSKEIDREYYCSIGSDNVVIGADEEKAVVSLV